MRLFPPPWEGRHPAFPSEENENAFPASCSHPSISLAAKAGFLGLVPLTIGTVFRLPRLRAFAFEATAYSAIIFSLYGLSTSRDKERDVIRTFLDGQGVEIPSRKFVDRLGKFDTDDAVIVGAIGGLVLAHRSRTPSISGWKRHLGAAVFGAALGCVPLTLVTFVTLQASANDVGKDLIKKKLYRASWEATMLRNMLDQADLSLRAGGIDIPVIAPSDPATLLAENGHDDGKKILMAQIGDRAIENELMIGTKELRLLPLKGEMAERVMTKNPPPSAYIKYLMSPFGSNAEEELEKHTLTIIQKREQVAFEAEHAWHHLAKKEAEYLDATRSLGEEADLAKRRYLEVLGTIHWSLWSRASQRDWMITHMQQRKQQLKTRPQESDIRKTSLPSAKPAPNATSTKLHFTTEILEGLSRRTEERRVNLQQSKRLLETVLSQLPIKPDRSHSSVGRPVPTREGYQHAITKLEKEIDAVEFDTKVIKQLIDDVELGWK